MYTSKYHTYAACKDDFRRNLPIHRWCILTFKHTAQGCVIILDDFATLSGISEETLSIAQWAWNGTAVAESGKRYAYYSTTTPETKHFTLKPNNRITKKRKLFKTRNKKQWDYQNKPEIKSDETKPEIKCNDTKPEIKCKDRTLLLLLFVVVLAVVVVVIVDIVRWG